MIIDDNNSNKLEVHSVERIYLRQLCFDASKPHIAASTGPNTTTCMGFFQRTKISRCRVAMHMLWEKGIRFRHPDCDPDPAQKLISSSMFQHLSTRNISSRSMHAFLSASLYFSKRGAYWDRLCRDVVDWLSRACTVAKRCILGL